MNCPYCQSEVHPEAVVCKTCRRDFYLFKPMMEKIAALESQIAAFPDTAALAMRIAQLESALAAASQRPERVSTPDDGSILTPVACLVAPLILLLIAHAVITIVLDINPLYLRIVSIIVPLPFGFLLVHAHRRVILRWFAGACLIAVIAVIAMSAITGLVDGTPVLPQNRFEWKEMIEYGASIAFSFLTGMLLSTVANASAGGAGARTTGPLMRAMSSILDDGKISPDKLHAKLKKLQEYGGTIVALGTTMVSIYTGLKSFL